MSTPICPNCHREGWMQTAGMIWCPACGYTDEMGKAPEVRPEMIWKGNKPRKGEGG